MQHYYISKMLLGRSKASWRWVYSAVDPAIILDTIYVDTSVFRVGAERVGLIYQDDCIPIYED
jgi:hypothetical protein